MRERESRFSWPTRIATAGLLTIAAFSTPAIVNPEHVAVPAVTLNPDCQEHRPLRKSVHDRKRLVPVNELELCVYDISGTLTYKKNNLDGDTYMEVIVDPEFEYLLNEKNREKVGGRLVVEAVCRHKFHDIYLEPSCNHYKKKLASIQNVRIGEVEKRVVFSGFLVIDSKNGWVEVHPVYDFHEEQEQPTPEVLQRKRLILQNF